jgi:hypothetical protein
MVAVARAVPRPVRYTSIPMKRVMGKSAFSDLSSATEATAAEQFGEESFLTGARIV